ncbi:precorrin-3B synthase, partial [Mycolicibacterium sp. KC 300]|nr:precorrin-3B synthase [Mycolicibacterium arseniciresistens]
MSRHRDQDACPGALSVHRAADGALARVRLPGGMVTPDQLRALAGAASEFGSPAMELTSRGNIQIRAVTDTAALADAVAAAGLLPSASHER